VAARSVVAKKAYPPFSILAGYPARVVGRRDVPATAARAEVKSLMEAVGA
jgi:acetyltransferase-like isoleucine patch superfamily enzyme